jgi:hypothetical protein
MRLSAGDSLIFVYDEWQLPHSPILMNGEFQIRDVNDQS